MEMCDLLAHLVWIKLNGSHLYKHLLHCLLQTDLCILKSLLCLALHQGHRAQLGFQGLVH